MKSRWLLNLALLVFLVGLLLLVRYVPRRHHIKPLPPLTHMQPAAIRNVTLTRRGKPTVRLERTGRHWELTAPLHARADQFRLDALLHVATARVHDRFQGAPGSLAKYGLDNPLATLDLDGHTIAFGGTEPLTSLRYVLYHGWVEVIPSFSFDPATVRVHDFFSTRLLEKNNTLLALDLPTFTLHSVQGVWKVTPPQPKLSSDAVNTFVDQWRYSRALSVTRYHRAPVLGKVTITTLNPGRGATPQQLVIDVLSEKPELVLYRPDEGLEYHFPKQVGTHLLHLQPAQ